MTFRAKTIAGITAAAMGLFTSGALAATFYSDVPAGHWAKPGIDWASQYGIMTGPGDMPGKFNPAGLTNRAELATVLKRMNDMQSEEILDLRALIDDLQERVEDLEDQMDDMEDDDDASSSRSSSRSSMSSSRMSSSMMSSSHSSSWMSSSPMSSSSSSASALSASSAWSF